MPDCSNSLSIDMLIGLYGSHHIIIPTKHFNFQLSIFNSSAFALPSLYLRSRFAPISDPAATPKGLFNGIGNAPLRYSYSCYSSIYPQSVIRVRNALRNRYSVTVPFPHCTTQPRSVILNCNNCSVTPTVHLPQI